MRNIAAYLLAVLGGNANPDAAAINKILASVGINGDAEQIEKLINELKGKDIQEVLTAGQAKLSTVSLGGGGGSAPAPSGGAAPAADKKAAAPAAEEKKKKDEPKEQSDEDMGFGLFD
eukprot:TRINITY_DN4150_c0_g1_i1.p1 TRINITY_DN4150_c0_g1~~TRINITY_DN4150_c0_g1_i1.p1  ORF type:complete len:118 (+),score=53.81 TRINITY_DN4150_c0_g1_i1:125-478(+)